MKASNKGKNSLFRNIYELPYKDCVRTKIYNSAKGNKDFIQRLALQRTLPVHNGCVNCICWNDVGDLILSGSDDQHLAITHAYTYQKLTGYRTTHRANIFSAKFLPCCSDRNIVSCSGDGIILFTDLFRTIETRDNQFNCHKGTTYELATIPYEPHTFLSCGEDYTVRCFDLRLKDKCNKENCFDDVLITCQRQSITALAVNNMKPQELAIGCSDSTVRIFDRRMITGSKTSCSIPGRGALPYISFTPPGLQYRSYRITSLDFAPRGDEVLVSYSSEYLYLFNTKEKSTMEYEPMLCDEVDEEEDVSEGRSSRRAPTVRRLRLRGDWSDTGPDARPERDTERGPDAAQARPSVHASLMQRMTDVLSRMLNDPITRAALSHGGEHDYNDYTQQENQNGPQNPPEPVVPEPSVPVVPEPLQAAEIINLDTQMEVDPVEVAHEVAATQSIPPPLASPPLPASTEEDTSVLPSFRTSFTNSDPPSLTPLDFTAGTSTSSTSALGPTEPNSLRILTNQLTDMSNNFVQTVGMEPMVNLTYSAKGTTASRISLTVNDEVNRERIHPAPQDTSLPTSEQPLEESQTTNNSVSATEVPQSEPVVPISTSIASISATGIPLPRPVVPTTAPRASVSATWVPRSGPVISLSPLRATITNSGFVITGPGCPITPQRVSISATDVLQSTPVVPISSPRVSISATGVPQSRSVVPISSPRASISATDVPQSRPVVSISSTRASISIPRSSTWATGVSMSGRVLPISARVPVSNVVFSAPRASISTSGTLKSPISTPGTLRSPLSRSETSISTSENPISTSKTPISTSKSLISISETPISSSSTPILTSATPILTSKNPSAPRALISSPEAPRASISLPEDPRASISAPETPRASISAPETPRASISTPDASEAMLEGSDDEDSELEMARIISRSFRNAINKKKAHHEIETAMEEAVDNIYPKFYVNNKTKVIKPTVKQKYTGHRNARTMIKEATFWGDDYVMSGSDCGHVFIWDRTTARLVMLLEADHHVVNCLQPHPFLPMLATSGIDYDVKLWAPTLQEANFNQELAEELVKRNKVMLEETRDTITVPASFMIRMLACLNQIRRAGGRPNTIRNNI